MIAEATTRTRSLLKDSDEIVEALRSLRPKLEALGVLSISIFGSVARGEAGRESDLDLAVVLDPAARISLLKFAGIERELEEVLGRPVDLVKEPVTKLALQQAIDRDRIRAF